MTQYYVRQSTNQLQLLFKVDVSSDNTSVTVTVYDKVVNGKSYVYGYDPTVLTSQVVDGGTLDAAYSGEQFMFVNQKVLNISDLKANPQWSDHGLYNIVIANNGVIMPTPENQYAVTLESKAMGKYVWTRTLCVPILSIAIPFEDAADFSTAKMFVRVNPNYGVIGNVASQFSTNVIANGDEIVYADYLPKMTVVSSASTVAAGGSVDITITLTDENGNQVTTSSPTAYLEVNAGYLPRVKVPLTNGVGKTSVQALGLVTGDTITVKAGFKYYSNVGNVTITVA